MVEKKVCEVFRVMFEEYGEVLGLMLNFRLSRDGSLE